VLRLLLQYLELILTAIGLGICCALIALLPPTMNKWQVIAIAAIVISLVHGLIFFAVKARQRAVRLQAIQDVAYLLQDQVTRYVELISCLAQSDNSGQQQMARQAAGDLAELVATLSDDSLQSWRSRHGVLRAQALEQPSVPQLPSQDR